MYIFTNSSCHLQVQVPPFYSKTCFRNFSPLVNEAVSQDMLIGYRIMHPA